MRYALERNLVLAASAGTGKTHALVGVVIHLLVADRLDPSRVVATTFSRKAAAEIRARVATELDKLASAPASSAYRASLRETVPDLDDDAIIKRARTAIARLPHARFGTLHSFATGIVRSYAVELGLGPGFDLATEADARARAEEAVAGALERRFAVTPEIVRALADASSGIDRLVTQLRRMLVQLEEDGRSPRELALAEGDEAALDASWRALIGHARALSVDGGRFSEVARDLASAASSDDEARIEAAAIALCAMRIAGKKTPEVESFATFRAGLPGTTNEERGRRLVRSHRARRRFAEHARLVREVLSEASQEIEDRGRARAELGFGEILRAARELLRDRPDVATEVASTIDALLVDEFQDTSRVQRDLLQLLWAKPTARKAGQIPPLAAIRERGLLVVGDRKQSIYGFRGADVGVFAELAVGLAGAPAREALGIPAGVTWEPKTPLADFHALRHNRRSVPSILAFANAFSARRFRPGEPPPELFEIDYVPETEDLLVPPEKEEAAIEAKGEPARTTWLRVKPKGSSSTRLEEALVIADRVRALSADGRELRDIAVLASTNGMLDAVAFALAQADIPYVVAGRSFFRTREIRDLAAFLAFVLDPSDRIAMLEVLRGPWAAVHDETLLALTAPGKGLVAPSQWSEPPNPDLLHDEDRAALSAISELVLALSRSAGRLGPGAILREGVRARSLEAVLAAMPRGDQRVANARKLLAIADRHADVRAFHRWLTEAMDQEMSESEAATFSEEDDAVRLLTIHASKGLDFPVVLIPEISAPATRTEKGAARIVLGAGDEPNVLAVRIADVDGIVLEPPSFASAWTDARRRERAERQRLSYVAITRAAEEMIFVGGRTSETTLDEGASSLAVLEAMAGHPHLIVEDVEVPAPRIRGADESKDAPDADAPAKDAARIRPAWRSLPIAPTALSDFAHCARRFELVHLLGLPEHVRPSSTERLKSANAPRAPGPQLDSRLQGTIAHAVLERLPTTAIGGKDDPTPVISRVLVTEGVAADHPQHAAIVARVNRFVRSGYARSFEGEADLRREVDFVLGVDDEAGRTVTLRGSMDLVVVWRDGSVDVVDYKSARGGDVDTYAFQLDVYALAARTMFPDAPRLRAGLVFLGGGSGEPVWRPLPAESEVRARLAALGDRLVDARWSESFPRVAIDRCEVIHCGFIGRCHASYGSPSGDASEDAGTEANPSRATTT